MKAKAVSSLNNSLVYLHHETLEWMKEAQFYLDEIEIFQHLIHKKQIPNLVGKQISRDVDLNLSTMANKIHKDVVRCLKEHEIGLFTLKRENNEVAELNYKEKHNTLATTLTNLKVSVANLKNQVHTFMLQKEFGVRSSTR